MPKKILMIHGRGFKPPRCDLQRLWKETLRFGIERDHPQKLAEFKKAQVRLVYFGDLTNEFLSVDHEQTVIPDLLDRKNTLATLKQYRKTQFTKSVYQTLGEYNSWMENFVDLFAGPLNYVGLTEVLIKKKMPDIGAYWENHELGNQIRTVFTEALIKAMKGRGEICVICHSFGSIVSYDTLWEFSHAAEYQDQAWNRKISRWITIGSPLTHDTVQRNLKGAGHAEAERFPSNIGDWINFAAEDDYVSHDQKVAIDYKAMKKLGYADSIKDHRIYNLSVRGGKLNPHHGTGYLIHPKVVKSVAEWL